MDWHFESMSGRSPRWRLRHAALAFSERLRRSPVGGVDAVLATSMMSLSDLRGTCPAALRDVPHVLYMHENQVAYPVSPNASEEDRSRDAHLMFTNLASIEAADRVVWNSIWNRDSFVEGMRGILARAPEGIGPDWIGRLMDRSVVVPPPVEIFTGNASGVLHNGEGGGYSDDGAVVVAWPHRWDFDKGCDEFLAIADRAWELEGRGGPRIRWCLLGACGSSIPPSLEVLCERHADRIVHRGWLDDPAVYRATLRQCDWVLSTSRHEFFGIAVAEALLEGCLPWLPRRLSYPELVPEEAFGLDPWTMPRSNLRSHAEKDRVARIRRETRERLEPAIAERSVARLEEEVRTAIDHAARSRRTDT